MESYSVEAILSAVDKGFTDSMRNADKSMNSLDSNAQKANTSILDIAKGVGVFKLVDSAIGMVKNSMDGAINRFDTLNKYPVVMEALGYSTQEVDKSMQKLTDGIDGLPTRLDDIVANTQQLAISTGSLDKGTDTAIALNNAFLASGASSDAASRGMEQYRQMLGRGEVDMQSFKSVQETMPIAMDKVAKSFEDRGVKSTNELYDALKKGDVTFTEFNDRLIELNEGMGGFADLAQKNSKGIKTSWANIQSAVVKGVEKTIRAIDEGLKSADLGGITDILDGVKNLVNQAFGVIQTILPPAIAKMVEFANVIKDVYNFLKPIMPLILTLIAYITTYQVVMGIANTVTNLFAGAQKLLNAVLAANPIGLVIAAIVMLISFIIYLWNTNEDFKNAVLIIWSNIQAGITVVMDAISNIINTVTSFFKGIWEKYHKEIELITSVVWTAIKTQIELTINNIKTTINVVLEVIKAIWKGSLNTIKVVAETIWNGIKITIETVMGIIQGVIKTVTSLISGDWQGVWQGMQQIVGSAWDGITGLIENGLQGAVDIITGWGKTFFDAGANIVNMIGDGIMSAVDTVKKAIGNVTESIRNYLPFSPAKEGPLRDLHRLNFGGTISTGIYAGAKEIDNAMNDVMDLPTLNDFNASFSGSNASYSNELTLRESNRPMQLNLRLGNQNFKAFVDDVSELMSENTVLELQT